MIFPMIIIWSWRNIVMIMPWWRHGGHVSCHGHYHSWHDHGMISMFFMIHTMIMVWSSCFPCFFLKKMDCLSRFCYYVPLYGKLDCLQSNLRLQIGESAKWTKTTPERLRVFFGNNQTASSYFNKVFSKAYILPLFVIFSNFEILGERSISVNVFRVVSDGFVQHIPH